MRRAHFLDKLVKLVPSNCAPFNKRVNSLQDKQGDPVALHFKDGTTSNANAVIGADGVYSIVRAYLFGKEVTKPVFAGSVAYRALVPMDKAVEKLGEEFAGNAFFIYRTGVYPIFLPISVLKSLLTAVKAKLHQAIQLILDPFRTSFSLNSNISARHRIP